MNTTWTTIESDPAVFTSLIRDMGVDGVEVEELYVLDAESLMQMEPVYGLVFLFKWNADDRDERETMSEDECKEKGVFFASQVINNACATQAILSILLNRPELSIGKTLSDLKAFTAEFTPELTGMAIGNCEEIRKAHNAFSRPEPFLVDSRASAGADEDVFHFISFVPVNGQLYELDGLKAGPINLGPCNQEDWLLKVIPVIQKKIEKYAASEILFNLLAVIKNRKQMYMEQFENISNRKDEINLTITKMKESLKEKCTNMTDKQENLVELEKSLELCNTEYLRLKDCIQYEDQKEAEWEEENVRRKHNYIPFLFNLLKILSEKNQLKPLIENAKERFH